MYRGNSVKHSRFSQHQFRCAGICWLEDLTVSSCQLLPALFCLTFPHQSLLQKSRIITAKPHLL